jgi:hypothetical protein
MTDIHSCSYYCIRPACVLAQRDELRDKMLETQRWNKVYELAQANFEAQQKALMQAKKVLGERDD